jgi:hypothetical protein
MAVRRRVSPTRVWKSGAMGLVHVEWWASWRLAVMRTERWERKLATVVFGEAEGGGGRWWMWL